MNIYVNYECACMRALVIYVVVVRKVMLSQNRVGQGVLCI